MTDLSVHNTKALMFFPALLLSLWLMPLANRYSFRLGAIDHPGRRKVHKRAVARLGGLAMVVGLVLPLVLFSEMDLLLAGFIVGLIIVTFTGLADDIYRIPPAAKFLGEVLAAGAFVWCSGVEISGFGNLFGTGDLHLGRIAPFVTVFCMVGVMNALNLSDGLDGLAGGISAIACAFLGVFAYLSQDRVSVEILLALLGALFGFLRYNTYPANLFMGDTGSLLLGYTLSAVAVNVVRNDGIGVLIAPVTAAAVLALPIIDTLLVMARRVGHGKHPFYPDRSHLHHRLMDLGFPHAMVVQILYLSSAAFGVQAWLLRVYPDRVQFLAVILLAVVVYGSVFAMQHLGFRWKGEEREGKWGAGGPEDAYSVMARVMGKSVRVAVWFIGFGMALPIVFIPEIPRSYGFAALAMLVFVGALFPWRSPKSNTSVCNGLMYLGCLCLLSLLQAVPGSPSWVPGYLAVMSAAVMTWVLLKMKYRGHREVLRISAFEMLLLGTALFVPLVLVPALGMDPGLRKMLLTVSLESVAFLLAMKIVIRRQARRNHMIAAAFMVALALLGVKSFFSWKTISDYVSVPARASSPSLIHPQ